MCINLVILKSLYKTFFFSGEGEVRVNMVPSLSTHTVSNLHDFQMEIT